MQVVKQDVPQDELEEHDVRELFVNAVRRRENVNIKKKMMRFDVM